MSLVYSVDAPSPGARRSGIYIGGKNDAKSLEKLERWNVSHILNVTPTKEASIKAGVPNYFETSRLRQFVYKRISVYDATTSAQDLLSRADEIVKFISNGLHHGSVLVHCAQGVSRSTTCVMFYLMNKAHLSCQDALKVVQRRRPEARPIPAFMDALQQYDEKTSEKRKAEDTVAVSSHPKRARKAVTLGPVGPTLPLNDKKSISIGPSLPPSSSSIGPSLPPSSSSIGPMPPPPATRDESIDPSPPPKKGPIGPTMPQPSSSSMSNEVEDTTATIPSVEPLPKPSDKQ